MHVILNTSAAIPEAPRVHTKYNGSSHGDRPGRLLCSDFEQTLAVPSKKPIKWFRFA